MDASQATVRQAKRRHAGSESSQQGVIADYEAKGFTGQFGARGAGQVICFACRATKDAGDVQVLAMHRLEGSSDPADQMVIVAVECPQCHRRGTLSLSYGPEASGEDKLVLKALDDRRGETGIRPGV